MQRDWPDIWGGLILAIIGISAAIWAGLHYDLGTPRRMGPGFFPVALGVTLGAIGLIIAVPALWRRGEAVRFDAAPLALILVAIVVFGLSLSRLGLVGVTFATVMIATLPAQRKGWVWRGVLALAITVMTVLVFRFGLRMSLPLWPRL